MLLAGFEANLTLKVLYYSKTYVMHELNLIC